MIYVDFDRTLFDTAKFIDVRDGVLKKEFGIELTNEDTLNFYQYVDDLYLYDFYDHMAKLGLTSDDVDKRLKPAMTQVCQSFVYDDAREIVDVIDFKILTFGQVGYQSFKFEFAPELEGIEKIVVFEHKDEYIVRQHGEDRVVLVDDKIDASRQHHTIDFIHLDRQGAQSMWQDETGLHISSLQYLSDALDSKSN